MASIDSLLRGTDGDNSKRIRLAEVRGLRGAASLDSTVSALHGRRLPDGTSACTNRLASQLRACNAPVDESKPV